MMEPGLSCYTRRDDGTLIFALEGTLDLATAPKALASLQRFAEENGPDVVVDASRLDFIDSRGVGVLLSMAKAARDAGGNLYLQNPTLPVRKILDVCGLSSLFPSAAARPTPAPPAAETAPAAKTSAAKTSAARAGAAPGARPRRRGE
jgi:anti-anti-sigma factor